MGAEFLELGKSVWALVEKMPHLALWIMAGFFAYKIMIIGSWFALAKLLIDRVHSWAMRPPAPPQPVVMKLGNMLCMVSESEVASVLYMVPRSSTTDMIHGHHLSWLRAAIAEKKDRESSSKQEKVK